MCTHTSSSSCGTDTPSSMIIKNSRLMAAHTRLNINPVDSFLATYGFNPASRCRSTRNGKMAGSV